MNREGQSKFDWINRTNFFWRIFQGNVVDNFCLNFQIYFATCRFASLMQRVQMPSEKNVKTAEIKQNFIENHLFNHLLNDCDTSNLNDASFLLNFAWAHVSFVIYLNNHIKMEKEQIWFNQFVITPKPHKRILQISMKRPTPIWGLPWNSISIPHLFKTEIVMSFPHLIKKLQNQYSFTFYLEQIFVQTFSKLFCNLIFFSVWWVFIEWWKFFLAVLNNLH